MILLLLKFAGSELNHKIINFIKGQNGSERAEEYFCIIGKMRQLKIGSRSTVIRNIIVHFSYCDIPVPVVSGRRVVSNKIGFNLGSRIEGRKVFEEIAKSMEAENGSEKIVIDFTGVRFMSLSFATELLDNLKYSNLFGSILIKETSPMIKNQLRFVIREMNEKNKDFQTEVALMD